MMLGGTGKACSSFFVKRIKKNYKKVLTGILFGGIISMKLRDQRNEERQVLNHDEQRIQKGFHSETL